MGEMVGQVCPWAGDRRCDRERGSLAVGMLAAVYVFDRRGAVG